MNSKNFAPRQMKVLIQNEQLHLYNIGYTSKSIVNIIFTYQ